MTNLSPLSQDRRRLVWVFLFLMGLLSLLIVQFYRIQIVQGEKWEKTALKQHHMVVIEPAKRGVFYSNTAIKTAHPESPKAFVIDVPKFHLYADPSAIPSECRDEIMHKISTALSLKQKDIPKIKEQLQKKSRSRKLILWLSQGQKDAINNWWLSYAKGKKLPRNALFFVQDYQRSYPYGKLLGQVLHTLREDKDLVTHQNIPTGGLEMTLRPYLQGKEGKRIVARSPRHALDTGRVVAVPEAGSDVYLTINHTLQTIAEEEIAKAVRNANAKAGWAIMMEPKTGEILALAQYPEFNLASYRTYFNDKALEEHTKVKAITDPYEPGSIMKPITLAIALKANEELKKRGKSPLFSPQEKITSATCSFPGRGKPLKDLRPHKFLNMYMGLQKSSNVYMAKLIQRVIERLGEEWYRSVLKDVFGFGEKVGVELPGESNGLLPALGKKHPNGTLEWSKATPYSLAMGHNILANGLQMLRAYALFANGGYDVHPTLIRKVVKANGEITFDNTKKEAVTEKERFLEPEIIEEVVRAMRYTVCPGGSATKAHIPGYTVAGKTGSSEKIVDGIYSKKNHISTFIGFAPVKNPQFILMIVIDEPEWKYIPGVGKNHLGGACAAPGFREIGARALNYLGIPPDDPDKKIWKEENAKLKQLYEEWNK